MTVPIAPLATCKMFPQDFGDTVNRQVIALNDIATKTYDIINICDSGVFVRKALMQSACVQPFIAKKSLLVFQTIVVTRGIHSDFPTKVHFGLIHVLHEILDVFIVPANIIVYLNTENLYTRSTH